MAWTATHVKTERCAVSMGFESPRPPKTRLVVMKRNRQIKTVCIMAALATLSSCSVKEDRTVCPCWLNMDITGCTAHTTELHISAWDPERIFAENIAVADYPETYERTVSRGMVATSAYCGLHESQVSDRHIIIPEGCQSDRLMAHANIIDCDKEFALDSVQLHRQYATVYMSMKGNKNDDERISTMEVRGEVCGIDFVTLEPVKGRFRYVVEADYVGVWSFRLPRQLKDSPLLLAPFVEGKFAEELPLHEWIAKSGYSWRDKDLKDIYLDVDYAIGKVSVVIQGWTEGESIDIIL